MPEEVPCILQLVSEYLKEPCPITTLSGSQAPTQGETKQPNVDRRGAHKVMQHMERFKKDTQYRENSNAKIKPS